MPSKATLFLIDGSNQMYRAYHAIRGLTGPDGKSTNAVYGFVDDAAQADCGSRAGLHRGGVRSARPDVPRRRWSTDYKANRTAMPGDLAEQIPWVHEACEALGVPVITSAGLRGRRCDRHAGDARRAEGFDVAIVTGDKDFFQLVDDGIRVYNPRDEGTWYDAAGVREKFGVGPEQVVDVLALMGDAVDNIKGVPGHRREGRAGADRHVRARSTPCSSTPARCRRRSIAKRSWRTPTMRVKAASCCASATDVPCGFDIDAFRFRGASRERCYALFSRLGFRSLVMEFAPTAETIEKQYRGGDHGRGARRARGGAAWRRAVCAAGAARRAHGDAGDDRGPRVRHRSSPRAGTCRSQQGIRCSAKRASPLVRSSPR